MLKNARIGIVSHSSAHIARWVSNSILHSDSCIFPINPKLPEPMIQHLLELAAVDFVIQDENPPTPFASSSKHPDSKFSTPIQNHCDLILATSGTTDEPKLACFQRAALETSAKLSAQVENLQAGDLWLNCLPLFHIGGLSILFRCRQIGAEMILHKRFDLTRIADDLSQKQITHLSLVPTMLARLVDFYAEQEISPPQTLRCVLMGGDRLPKTLAHRALQQGWPLLVSYGMTETGSRIAAQRLDLENIEDWEENDVGKPLPGVEISFTPLADQPDGQTSAHHSDQIRIAGKTLLSGYLENGAVVPIGNSGFLTRDVGSLDERGHLHVTGRIDDAIITGGETVHPAQVEALLRQAPEITGDIAVTSIADTEWGQAIVAVIETGKTGANQDSQNVKMDLDALKSWINREMPPFLRPRHIFTVEKLPRNALGKIQRKEISPHSIFGITEKERIA